MKKSLNRYVRKAEEFFTSTEKTGLDEDLQNKLKKALINKDFMEDMIDKIETITGSKMSTKEPLTEQLGECMVDAGNELGTDEPYGASLVQAGECQKLIGKAQRDFFNACIEGYLIPMKSFLDGDMKELMQQKATLENRRLDLDTLKKKLRKTDHNKQTEVMHKDFNNAQSEFDRQREVVEILANQVVQDQLKHIMLLRKFVEIQLDYYHMCYKAMYQLNQVLTEGVPLTQPKVKGEHSGGNVKE